MNRLLTQGTLIGSRFVIEEVVSDSMSLVFRAMDAETGQRVALKALSNGVQELSLRASREVDWLTRLAAPNIVRYVAHGTLPSGGLFIATEWIDGEDLAQLLSRQPLTLAQSLLVIRQTAEALALVHSRGIVHGDIKPANLRLRQGNIEELVLLDFGIASEIGQLRRSGESQDQLVGTIGYLAPERARGGSGLSPRTDIFSLGCVLFECLTGEAPFAAETVGGVLTRILFDEPATAPMADGALPESVRGLLFRMLAKDPAARPADATALIEELDRLGPLPVKLPSGLVLTTPAEEPTLTGGEQRLVTLIVAQGFPQSDDSGGSEVRGAAVNAALRSLLSPFGVEVTHLADGTRIITLSQLSSNEATDQAEQTVRGALLVKQRWPEVKILVTTGRERLGRRQRLGLTVDRALRLLALPDADEATASRGQKVPILDELTASLVEIVFDVTPIGSGRMALEPEHSRTERSRLLLGKPTPFVGREHDVSVLDTTLSFCLSEPTARMVLVTAPPGFGKSRLRQEFIRRQQRRGPPLLLLSGRGDLMGVGSPFQLVASVVRSLCKIDEREPAEVQRAKLSSHVRSRAAGEDSARIAAFLGELCGIPFSLADCPQLAGAYQNPRVMNAQVTQAWLDLVAAELTRQPLLLVLEDLHWSDALSIGLIQAALRELAARPLMILALSRPEIEELFPSLCQERSSWMLRLGRLSRKASERLIRHALSDRAADRLVEQLVHQADGNPLFLEELARAVSEAQSEDLPDTVLAILEARLMRLSALQRRLLRAASIFGERFNKAGVLALMGRQSSLLLDRCLADLIESEFIEPESIGTDQNPTDADFSSDSDSDSDSDSRSAAARRFRFRHELFRAASYDLLTPDDRQLGHRLAAQFLEQHGGRRNLRRLAEHFFAGGLTEQARTYFLAAAELALANSDLDGALKCVQSGIDNQASGELLGGLRAVELQAHFWRDEWAEALACGQEALALLPKGSARWSAAAAVLMPTTSMSGQLELFRQLAAELPQVQPEPSAVPAYFGAVSYLAISTSLIGSRLEARQLIALLRHYLPSAGHPDGLIEQGLLTFSELVFRRTFVSDLWINYRLADAATRVTTISGDLRTLLFVQAYLGRSLTELGDFESAEQVLTTCLELSHRLNEPLLTAHVRVQYETLLLSTGDPTHLLQALESARLTVDNQRTNPLLRGQAMTNLADAQLRSGQLVEAELSARSAEGLLHDVPNSRLLALCMLAFSQLRLGRPEQALRLIGDARDRLTLHPGVDSKSVFLLVNTLIRQGCGDPAAAMAKQEAEDYFLEASQSIPDPQLRARYLQQAFAPRRLRELARS